MDARVEPHPTPGKPPLAVSLHFPRLRQNGGARQPEVASPGLWRAVQQRDLDRLAHTPRASETAPMIFPALLLVALLALLALRAFWLRESGRRLRPAPPVVPLTITTEAEGLARTERFLRDEFHLKPRAQLEAGADRADLLRAKREMFDREGAARDHGAAHIPVAPSGPHGVSGPGGVSGPDSISGEWTLAPGADPRRRMLYLHGGGFTVGSALSHRAITAGLSRGAGCAVFAPDYRLMPEHSRLDSLRDAMTAYRWLLEHGPDGPARTATSTPDALFIGGDSAGGNLALALLQAARGAGLRPADAAVLFSPSTDYTLSAPSLRANFDTDTMLQPLARPLLNAPRALLPFAIWKAMGARPTDPRVSPLFGRLHALPPTLIQVSATEMLLDDARRYAARARAAGSPVTLEIWQAPAGAPPLPHVWHIFAHWLPGARDALGRAGTYLTAHVQ